MIKVLLKITLIVLLAGQLQAQQKYWIYFKDKSCSTSAKSFYDQPICLTYTDSLITLGFKPIVKSKWLNAITILADHKKLESLRKNDFIERVTPVNSTLRASGSSFFNSINYSPALQQINASALHDRELTGKGVAIGVIDGGFLGANEDEALKTMLDSGRIKGYKNFVERKNTDPYAGSHKNNDRHGSIVLTAIGGKTSTAKYGIASDATYYLARTDQGDKEYRGEEDYWIEALEWMYDQGVRLVNSSVGYSDGYDNPAQNYKPEDIDGESSAITQAATIAAKEKGMLLVIAAGNDGNVKFEVISKPADAKGVLSVGATGNRFWDKAGYSSTGPEKLKDIKPEVSCYSSAGTSFSAPVITGLAAAIMQAWPDANNKKVLQTIKDISHLKDYPNNYIGYGVPDCNKFVSMLTGEPSLTLSEEIRPTTKTATVAIKSENIVIFHKKDEHNVLHQHNSRTNKKHIVVEQLEGATRTTVASPSKVIEIFWPDSDDH